MNARRYRWSVVLTVGALVAFMIAFPYLLVGLVRASSCGKVSGACGAVAAVGGMLLKPLILIVMLAALMALVQFRCKALGVSRWWLLAVLGWFAGSWSYLFAAGNFWGATFGAGILRVSPPVLLLACAAFLAFLCVDTTPSDRRGRMPARAGWTVAALAGAHAALGPLLSLLAFATLVSLPHSPAFWKSAIAAGLLASKVLNLGLDSLLVQWIDVTVLATALLCVLLTKDRGGGSTARPSEGEAFAR